MPSVAVRNFGCRANQAEAFAWAGALQARGLTLEERADKSDIVLVHSCTLTGRADRDVRKFIRAVHRENERAKIVVTGCYAERAPAEIAGLPGVVAVLPQAEKGDLVGRVLALDAVRGLDRGHVPPARVPLRGDRTAGTDGAGKGDMYPVRVPLLGEAVERSFRARAFLKVQDGCDNRCAFCVIPGLRGPSVSVPPGDVVASVRDLALRGFREVVIAGIHLASYGLDLRPRLPLLDLLRETGGAAKPARLRLSSLDPALVDDTLIGHLAAADAICRHFHLSLQHASERVLREMGRPGGSRSYEELLSKLALRMPDAALGADIIVGFPGETDADSADLEAFIEASALTYVHVFPFSPRPGTPAWGRPRVPDGVVTARAQALRRLSAEKDLRFRERFLGRELEAVVIRSSEQGAEVLTANDIKVAVPRSAAPRREIVRVRIGRVLPLRTEGEVVG